MHSYTFSQRARQDLKNIYKFSILRFGQARTDSYLKGLKECCEHLAEQPLMGRKVEYRKGYFHYEYISHTIFYKRRKGGVLIMRVPHHHMDVPRHI